MATYSITLLIKGKLDISDAEFLKLLELDKSVTGFDEHKIGKENADYEYAISSANGEQVFISTFDQFTVIVSFLLIQDYSGTIGLIQNKVAKIFPESEYFLFFSETVSMLNGFIYGIGSRIIRKKYVQNGRYVNVYDHIMDIGELLIEEKLIYNNPSDFVDNYPTKNKEYMYGSSDFNIALSFIERQLKIKDINKILYTLTFNKNILSELSTEYIEDVSQKLINKDVELETIDTLKPLMRELKFKKIDFKEDSQNKKSKGFYKQLNATKRIVIEVSFFSMRSRNQVSIDISLKKNDEKFTNMLDNNVRRNLFGIVFFSIDSRIIMSKLHSKDIASINSRKDLVYFINTVKDNFPTIKELIGKAGNVEIENFFNDEVYFNDSLKVIKENSALKKRLTSDERLNYCLQYHSLNNSQHIANKILEVIDFDYNTDNLKDSHIKNVNKAKEIIQKNIQR